MTRPNPRKIELGEMVVLKFARKRAASRVASMNEPECAINILLLTAGYFNNFGVVISILVIPSLKGLTQCTFSHSEVSCKDSDRAGAICGAFKNDTLPGVHAIVDTRRMRPCSEINESE